jgi:hypothetical protein
VVEVTDNCDPVTAHAYKVEAPDAEMVSEGLPTPPLITEENLCFSLRNAQGKMERVDEKAMATAKKRDIEGIPQNLNSFDALSNPDLILRDVKMGVNIPDTDFASVDILRKLEKCRNMESINKKNDDQPDLENKNMVLTNAKGDQTPLTMEWVEENDVEEDKFTVVRSS